MRVLKSTLTGALLIVAIGLMGCSAGTSSVQPTSSGASSADTPAASTGAIDGAALLQERCSVCHSVDQATAQTRDTAGWTTIVDTMIGKGANLSAEERDALISYLAEQYGQ